MKNFIAITCSACMSLVLVLSTGCLFSSDDNDVDGGTSLEGGTDAGADALPDPSNDCLTFQPLTESITSDTTLDGCYLVENHIYVREDARLTIAAGSTLKFKQDTALEISGAGSLTAEGTAQRPILFTGDVKVPGSWRGILIHNSLAPENRLDYIIVEYGGGYDFVFGEPANLALTSSGTPVAATLTNSILRHSAGYGFFFSNKAKLAPFANNTFTANESGAGCVEGDAAAQLDNASNYAGNTRDVVWIKGEGLDGDQTWPAINVPYEIDGLVTLNQGPSVILTIEAGAVLTFRQDAGLEVGQDGALVAKGTADQPITFTRASGTAGHWRGIQFHNSVALENEIDHAIVEYGGSYDYVFGEPANIALTSSGTPVKLKLTNTTLQHSIGYGFFLRNEATLGAFAHNTITANALGAGYVVGDAAGQIDKTSSYTGNEKDMVWVDAQRVNVDQTWPAIDVPYVIDNSIIVDQAPGVTLTIEAGATLQFRGEAGLEVGQDGTLVAKGTAGLPITFTRAANAADWRGIQFHNSASAENEIDHATVEYGGSYNFPFGDAANIALTSSGTGVQLKLSNSTVRNSLGYGVWVCTEANFTDQDNTYSSNALVPDVFYEQ